MGKVCLQRKAHTMPLVAVVGFSVIGVGLLSDGVAMADTTSVTDTINVTVSPSCTFQSTSDKNYAGSAVNGAAVENFNDSGEHVFNIFCNNHSGFTVSATPHNLTDDDVQNANIAYVIDDDYAESGDVSLWTTTITSNSAGLTLYDPVLGGGPIVTSSSNTPSGGVSFKATYQAYVGAAMPAGTYTGTIAYTLVPTGSSNSGSSSSSESQSGPNSQVDAGTSSGEESNSGNATNGTNASNTDSSTPETDTNNSLSTPSLTTATNNTYNTYNTYNTTAGQSSGSVAATPSSTALTLMSNDDNDKADDSNNNGSNTSSSYESPLGVTTTKTSTNKESGEIDPMPIVATGILVTAGLAAIALIKKGSKEEDDK